MGGRRLKIPSTGECRLGTHSSARTQDARANAKPTRHTGIIHRREQKASDRVESPTRKRGRLEARRVSEGTAKREKQTEGSRRVGQASLRAPAHHCSLLHWAFAVECPMFAFCLPPSSFLIPHFPQLSPFVRRSPSNISPQIFARTLAAQARKRRQKVKGRRCRHTNDLGRRPSPSCKYQVSKNPPDILPLRCAPRVPAGATPRSRP